jgi:predicted site-specific integrase-resolvase
VKLAEWARSQDIHPQTAYRWFREGTMPVPARRLPTGTIVLDSPAAVNQGGAALYARVPPCRLRAAAWWWPTGESPDDLMRDMIEVLTSLCVRLYGRRGARNRALRALTAAKATPERDGR